MCMHLVLYTYVNTYLLYASVQINNILKLKQILNLLDIYLFMYLGI